MVHAFDVALCVADSALRVGIIDRDDLLIAAERAARGPGRGKALRVASEASHLRANPFETCLYVIASSAPGLDVVPQGHVPGVGFVDLLERRLGMVMEAESLEHHWTKAGLQRDVDRYTKAVVWAGGAEVHLGRRDVPARRGPRGDRGRRPVAHHAGSWVPRTRRLSVGSPHRT